MSSENSNRPLNLEIISAANLSPALEKALAQLQNPQQEQTFRLPLLEMQSIAFLRKVAELKLSHEVSFVESDGDGVMATGILDAHGVPSAGTAEIIERHKKGEVSIHSHVGQEIEDLCPSIGDIEILGMNRMYAGARRAPIIMNSKGILVFGFNPDYKKLEEEAKGPGKHTWQLMTRYKWRWKEIERDVRNKSKTIDRGLQEFYAFLEKEGLIRCRKMWDEVVPNDLKGD